MIQLFVPVCETRLEISIRAETLSFKRICSGSRHEISALTEIRHYHRLTTLCLCGVLCIYNLLYQEYIHSHTVSAYQNSKRKANFRDFETIQVKTAPGENEKKKFILSTADVENAVIRGQEVRDYYQPAVCQQRSK